MSTTTPNPNNLILLAALGIGAYWVLTRRAVAMPVPGRTTTTNNASAVPGILGAIGKLFGGSGSPGGATGNTSSAPGFVRQIFNDDTPGQPGYGWNYYENGTAISPNGTYYQNGTPVWSPDGIAVNPPNNVSAYDFQDLYQG